MLQPKINSFLHTYKWLLIPSIPLLLFILLTAYLFTTPSQQDTTPSPQELSKPTSVPQNRPTPRPIILPPNNGVNHDEDLLSRPGLQKIEPLPDGTRYIFTSSNPARPNIFITANRIIIFERLVRSQNESIHAGAFVEDYGQPLLIIKGSHFYGENARLAIFEHAGKALIYDPTTFNVYEQHSFIPMSSDEYLQRYGTDVLDAAAIVDETIPESSTPLD